MKKLNSIELLTGFLMGLFLGFCIEGVFVFIFSLLSTWFGWARLEPAWWMMIPIPLVLGAVMAKAIASLHLEDY